MGPSLKNLTRSSAASTRRRLLAWLGAEREVYSGLSRSLPVAHALEIAHALARAGDTSASLRLLDGLLARYPRSSAVLLERARCRPSGDPFAATQDLVHACRGDLRSAGVLDIALAGIEVLEPEGLSTLRAEIASLAHESPCPEEIEAAVESLDLVVNYCVGRNIAHESTVRVPETVLVNLVRRCRNNLSWDSLDDIEFALSTRRDLGALEPSLTLALAEARRASGALSLSVDLARPFANDYGPQRAREIVASGTDELALLEHGWQASKKAPLRRTRGSRVAYAVATSMPHSTSGYATRTHGFLGALQGQGWDVLGVTRPGYPFDVADGKHLNPRLIDQPLDVDGVHYRHLDPAASRSDLVSRVECFADHLVALDQSEQWSLIHAASNHTIGLAAVEAAARLGVPSIYEVRGMWNITRASRDPGYAQSDHFRMVTRLEVDAARLADHAFAITSGLRNLMIDHGVPADRISVLPNGVDVERFRPQPPDPSLKRRLGLDGKVVLGYVGSVVDYEGLELLVEASRLLVDEGLPVALLIVGDGASFASVQNRVVELQLQDHVVMPGRVPHAEAEAYYSVIDIAPFPRLPLPVTELVSPLKPFEAMAMAKPIVVSSVAALNEIVTDRENGVIFAKGDVQDLARVLAELVGDGELRRSLGETAREWVVANRSWDSVAGSLAEVYEGLGLTPPLIRER